MPDETPKLGLPLLQAAQAQKHLTVNEALIRLDALINAAVLSIGAGEPPTDATDGDAHVVGPDAGGDWAGRDGALAFRVNGGWRFARPTPGQRIWLRSEARALVFDGEGWAAADGGSTGSGAAATALQAISVDHAITGGATSTTAPIIPDKAIVLGVTGRVVEAVTGTGLTGWRLGVAGGPDRYGSGYGLAVGSFAHGVTGQPQAYYGATPLLLTAEGGVFAGGLVRLRVHLLTLTPPDAP
jgi:hypothetical protein